jgi:ADP-ribosyl-[dinitrogen reductase] hydrolase
MDTGDRLTGVLLGTAVGDALGVVTEGMSAKRIARRFGRVDRFRLYGNTGYVSDDTEQSALVAPSLVRHPGDIDAFRAAFRRSLLGWFLRLPWGLGLATLRACIRIGLGFREAGVVSAGNGAAMRAAVVGVFFATDDAGRRVFGEALARVTHTDPRAVSGALFVADVAAALSRDVGVAEAVAMARTQVSDMSLATAIDRAAILATQGTSIAAAANELGNTGFVIHSVPLATCVALRFGDDPRAALVEAIGAGGDTDSTAAIVGAWMGTRHGPEGLPQELVHGLQRGPFGKDHLVTLGDALAMRQRGEFATAPRFSWPIAMARNLALLPVVFVQGVRALLA